MNKKIAGFTLIELLVVIAIIGVLAAIVLVSVTGATKKAKDARIIADLSQVRSQAALIYSDNGSYASTCNAAHLLNTSANPYATALAKLQKDIETQQNQASSTSGTNAQLVCYAGSEKYCVAAKLVYKSNKWYCVDAEGYAGEVNSTSSCATNQTCK